ncbi:hypothetical protein NDU88_003023 [Pleurodeles waltl]|uniref:Uncharacterized protein n=1 Tax=Pleurodeles waltl TaxID=8319 RepID=A0AAV7V194_PLEWA|nr:hypothetical protein NDU88_003023 [Pleurodeles waltl]
MRGRLLSSAAPRPSPSHPPILRQGPARFTARAPRSCGRAAAIPFIPLRVARSLPSPHGNLCFLSLRPQVSTAPPAPSAPFTAVSGRAQATPLLVPPQFLLGPFLQRLSLR